MADDMSGFRSRMMSVAYRMLGSVADAEMLRVFNMGVGFVVIASPSFANSIVEQFDRQGVPAWVIGDVRAGEPGVEFEG